MSRKLDVASALLFIVGIWGVFEGLMALFSPESYLGMWIGMMNTGLRPPTLSQIGDFSQNLLGFMLYVTQWYGFYALFGALLFCVTSLIPYRKGEKWAWYVMLVIGGILMFGGEIVIFIGMSEAIMGPVTMHTIMLILWIVGLALPAKEILGKPS